MKLVKILAKNLHGYSLVNLSHFAEKSLQGLMNFSLNKKSQGYSQGYSHVNCPKKGISELFARKKNHKAIFDKNAGLYP